MPKVAQMMWIAHGNQQAVRRQEGFFFDRGAIQFVSVYTNTNVHNLNNTMMRLLDITRHLIITLYFEILGPLKINILELTEKCHKSI